MTWQVNVLAHVWAARALLPAMVQRGDGYLLSTASAAGLLTQLSALAYSAAAPGPRPVAVGLSR
jgi:short-subunit dehydrogenase